MAVPGDDVSSGFDWLRLSAGGPAVAIEPPPAPDRVGPYEILSELGRGGMGVVYKARHATLQRVAALKMLLAGQHAGDDARRRFLTEASALARLTHPNIVPVFEVGEHRGLPYFAMELVAGEPLSAVMARGPVPSSAAAGLVETVARAVEHAHSQGVVHRDLKPANVLLTEDGTPRVADFGVARLLEQDAGLTRPGQLVGTPAYMAPELLSGAVAGPASDVYSLGVILYELLCGRTPFAGDSIADLLFQVTFQEPIPPGRWRRGVPADLETVVLRCLEREPAARYRSAAELADELRRYLEGRPVLARPIGPVRRAWRWAKRNPAVASLTAAVAVLLVAAITSLGAGLAVARRDRDAAVTARDHAERRERQARRALDLMTSAVFDDLLVRQHELQPGRRDFLEKARAEYAELADSDDPAFAAAASARLGIICRRLGQSAEAEASYRQAIALFERLDDPDLDTRRRFAATVGNLGGLLDELGRTSEADAAFRRSIHLLDADGGDRRADQIRAQILAARGQTHADRPAEAAAFYEQARTIQSRLRQEEPDGDVRLELASTLNGLGTTELLRGKSREAERHLREALKLWAGSDRPDVRDSVSGCRTNLGALLVESGRTADGLTELKTATEAAEKLAAEFPAVGRYRLRLASARAAYGSGLKTGPAALAELDGAIVLLTRLRAEYAADRLYRHAARVAYGRRAFLNGAAKRFDDALADCNAAIDASRGADADGLRVLRLMVLVEAGRHADAVADLTVLRGDSSLAASTCYDVARVAAVARVRTTTPAAFHEGYAALAVGLLVRANDGGLFRDPTQTARLRADRAFVALRDREDYQPLEAASPSGLGKDR